jgi:hypothetical protein
MLSKSSLCRLTGEARMQGLNDVLTTTDGPAVPAEASPPSTLLPLAVSALMVTKADLVAALRAYLPHLSDIEAIDQDRFLLSVGPHDGAPGENGAR